MDGEKASDRSRVKPAPVVAPGATTLTDAEWRYMLGQDQVAQADGILRPRTFADRTFETTAQQIEDAPHLRPVLDRALAGAMDFGRTMDQVGRTLEATRAEDGIRALLRLMGEDPDREGIRDTPSRVVKAYLEMASRPGDPAELLSRTFGDVGQSSEMICVPGIEFVSLCEHHLLPFTGTAAVAYIPRPGGAVVGLSKIPRLVHHWAMRPQVQERLTRQIADSLETHLTVVHGEAGESGGSAEPPLGVAVRIDSRHSCMSLRGVKATAASMVTTDLRGRFLEGAPRAEFLGEAMR
jgi:GTP cyclohydrolase I